MIQNVIITVLIILILGGAAFYIYKKKKKGSGCIGCPYAEDCKKNSCCAEYKR